MVSLNLSWKFRFFAQNLILFIERLVGYPSDIGSIVNCLSDVAEVERFTLLEVLLSSSPIRRNCGCFCLPFVLFFKPIVLTVGDFVFIAIGTIYDIGSEYLSSTPPLFQKENDECIKG